MNIAGINVQVTHEKQNTINESQFTPRPSNYTPGRVIQGDEAIRKSTMVLHFIYLP